MGRPFLKLVPWLLLCAACAHEPVSIAADQSRSGTIRAGRFDLQSGATLTLTGNLVVEAEDDITIEGEIMPAPGVPASLTLRTRRGDISIFGNVRAGDGESKPLVATPNQAIGADAGTGGSVALLAPAGDVYVRGSIIAGSGGQGGMALATAAGGTIYAEGGDGGGGGNVTILARDQADVIGASIRGGSGGNGGWATAQVDGIPDIDTNVAVGTDLTPPNRELLQLAIERLEDAPVTLTRARSGAGGPGGHIDIGGRRVLLTVAVESGFGGLGGEAKARFGHAAEAVALRAGRSGDVTFVADPRELLPLTPPVAAFGRNGGRAIAFALHQATASSGPGGDPGSVSENGVKVETRDGGDGGAAIVQTFDPALRRAEGPPAHNGAAPGRAARATIP